MSEQSTTPQKLTGTQRLLEAGLLVSCLFAMFVMLALYSFDPADPGWAQTGYDTPIRNLGGAVGAFMSDLLLNVFGFIAYSLPFVIALVGWLLFQKYHRLMQIDYLTLGLKFIGFIMLFIGVTSIASMNFDDLFYFSAGGILGDVVSQSILPYFSFVGSSLLFLMLVLSGFVLLTGISLLQAIDKVGEYVIKGAMSLSLLPAWLSEKFGTQEPKPLQRTNHLEPEQAQAIEDSRENELEAPELQQIEIDHTSEQHNESELAFAPNLDNITTGEEQEPFAESAEAVPFQREKQEPFVDIDELMGEPLAINVQEHVSDEEIAAAFEGVEPVVVEEESSNAAAQPVEKADYEGMPALDLLDQFR